MRNIRVGAHARGSTATVEKWCVGVSKYACTPALARHAAVNCQRALCRRKRKCRAHSPHSSRSAVAAHKCDESS